MGKLIFCMAVLGFLNAASIAFAPNAATTIDAIGKVAEPRGPLAPMPVGGELAFREE